MIELMDMNALEAADNLVSRREDGVGKPLYWMLSLPSKESPCDMMKQPIGYGGRPEYALRQSQRGRWVRDKVHPINVSRRGRCGLE